MNIDSLFEVINFDHFIHLCSCLLIALLIYYIDISKKEYQVRIDLLIDEVSDLTQKIERLQKTIVDTMHDLYRQKYKE